MTKHKLLYVRGSKEFEREVRNALDKLPFWNYSQIYHGEDDDEESHEAQDAAWNCNALLYVRGNCLRAAHKDSETGRLLLEDGKEIEIVKTLDLVLTHKWYDMIESGEKKEEYRRGAYWAQRLCKQFHEEEGTVYHHCLYCDLTKMCGRTAGQQKEKYQMFNPADYALVRFRRGYTNTTMTFHIDKITFGRGRTEWGAPADEDVIKIILGKRHDNLLVK